MSENKRAVGTDVETLAAKLVSESGARIITRNFRSRQGEIDLIFQDGEYTVFAEVKYRTGHAHGTAPEAVDVRKQRKICRVCDYYRVRYGLKENAPVRFDVIAAESDAEGRIHFQWIRNAFEYIGTGY